MSKYIQKHCIICKSPFKASIRGKVGASKTKKNMSYQYVCCSSKKCSRTYDRICKYLRPQIIKNLKKKQGIENITKIEALVLLTAMEEVKQKRLKDKLRKMAK